MKKKFELQLFGTNYNYFKKRVIIDTYNIFALLCNFFLFLLTQLKLIRQRLNQFNPPILYTSRIYKKTKYWGARR